MKCEIIYNNIRKAATIKSDFFLTNGRTKLAVNIQRVIFNYQIDDHFVWFALLELLIFLLWLFIFDTEKETCVNVDLRGAKINFLKIIWYTDAASVILRLTHSRSSVFARSFCDDVANEKTAKQIWAHILPTNILFGPPLIQTRYVSFSYRWNIKRKMYIMGFSVVILEYLSLSLSAWVSLLLSLSFFVPFSQDRLITHIIHLKTINCEFY